MEKSSQEKLYADWIATQNIARFQILLKGEADESRYRILTKLIADEFGKLGRNPSPPSQPQFFDRFQRRGKRVAPCGPREGCPTPP